MLVQPLIELLGSDLLGGSDPSMQAVTEAQIEATVKNGKGKMKPPTGLSEEQVKAVAAYFKTLK
jgi:mono/diheme cytochrome c family protein